MEGPNVQSFINWVKSRAKPNCDLDTVRHPASLLCHAGNIAARLGRSLKLELATETFLGEDQASRLRPRPKYRKPWDLPKV